MKHLFKHQRLGTKSVGPRCAYGWTACCKVAEQTIHWCILLAFHFPRWEDQGLLRAGGINPSKSFWGFQVGTEYPSWPSGRNDCGREGVKVCMGFALRNYACFLVTCCVMYWPNCAASGSKPARLQDYETCPSIRHVCKFSWHPHHLPFDSKIHVKHAKWRAQLPARFSLVKNVRLDFVLTSLPAKKPCELRQDMLMCFQQLDFFGVLKENLLSSWCFSDKKEEWRSFFPCVSFVSVCASGWTGWFLCLGPIKSDQKFLYASIVQFCLCNYL